MKIEFELERLRNRIGKYCPCKVQKTSENVCPCVEFLSTGKCICLLFKEVKNE